MSKEPDHCCNKFQQQLEERIRQLNKEIERLSHSEKHLKGLMDYLTYGEFLMD